MNENYLESAIDAAIAAGAKVKETIGKAIEIRHKGEIDLVTEVDTQNEELIYQRLKAKHPRIGCLSEEGTGAEGKEEDVWIVDPLDGTTNFAHGYPHVGISIALKRDGKILLGVVYNPFQEELFYAEHGSGAYLNKKRIFVSATEILNVSLLSTGFPYRIRENPDPVLNLFRAILLKCQGVRRDGAASLDLCYVAAGRLDGFWEMGLKSWDMAAGKLIVKEAEGMVTDFQGRDFFLDSPSVIASNGRIHRELLKIILENSKGD